MDLCISRRLALAGCASLAAVGTRAAQAGVVARRPVVLELFTSQGCSSCPKADALFANLATDPDVLALSFNVDYWDYLGWRDTLARPEFSQRQYDYAKSRGDNSVFTPQIVAEGQRSVVGSDGSAVRSVIKDLAAAQQRVAMDVSLAGQEITVTIAQQAFSGSATLWLMGIAHEVSQPIERGENAGQVITYHNVVRTLVPAAMWSGEAFKNHWMRDAVMTDGCTNCVAVLQEEKTGPILAAALL